MIDLAYIQKNPETGEFISEASYIEDHRNTTIQVTCIKCWRHVDAVAVEPEFRTNIRTDGELVEVLCKRVVDHEFGSAWAMLWRRDHIRWMFRLSFALTVTGAFMLIWEALQ